MGARSSRRRRSAGGTPHRRTRLPRRGRQLELTHASRGRGGPRPGAGRPPQRGRRPVPHRRRASVGRGKPQHVTTRLLPNLPSMRTKKAFRGIRRAIQLGHKPGFRVVHFSVMTNHLHLLVEATDKRTLAAGLKGLKVRVAKALNRAWARRGTVFAERYHVTPIDAPRQARHVLGYVLNNRRRHAAQSGRTLAARWVDPFSSARQFDGWRQAVRREEGVVANPRTWLLRTGWRRAGGGLDVGVVPGPEPP